MNKQSTIGIDVGKSNLYVSYPVPDLPPKEWPVQVITYDDPAWHVTLIDLIAPVAVVAFEPTGWHLVAPLVTVLTQLTNAQIWLVGHGTTGRIREVHISSAKTDQMDARALAQAAVWIAEGQPPATARQHNVTLEEQTQRLRTLVNNLHRQTRQATRLKNRLHAFTHAIWPLLDIKFTTWLALAEKNIITPQQIKAYAAELPADRNRSKTGPAERLAADLPDITPPRYAVESIQTTIDELTHVQQQMNNLKLEIGLTITDIPHFKEAARRILTIPGSGGDITRIAPFIVASHGLIDRMTADEFKSAVGISAKTDTSGSVDKTRAKKGGYKPAQVQLFMWTMQLLSPSAPVNPVKSYYDRIKRQGKQKPGRSARAKLAMLISGVARSPEGYRHEM